MKKGMSSMTERPIALITGAAGGIGAATARRLGLTMDLILTDVSADRLETLAASLEADGSRVLARPIGPLEQEDVVAALIDALPRGRSIDVLVHAAGLASVQGDWQASVRTNIVASRRLLATVEPRMAAGGVAVLLSSLAGHAAVPVTAADTLIDDWQSPSLLADLAPLLAELPEEERSGRCYVLAKRMIIRLCETLSLEWAKRGARILSISPGLVDTPMGRAEAASNPAAKQLLATVPLGAYVQPLDIAAAIAFLVSPSARFITGCDLKIDGGLQAALNAMTR
jgi:NAD(P)-dependent dehydrogenase (short-subunit alcohol dehydrogenase family)